jgi:hypothetical protein
MVVVEIMETRNRFTVDSAHCQRAEDELYEILKAQELRFATRWNESRVSRVTTKVAVIVGMGASVAGLVGVAALLYFDTRAWASQPHPLWLAVFAAFAVVFAFIPRLGAAIRAWSLRAADGRARRNAARGVRDARRMAPFAADYEYKTDVLTYARGKDDKWQFVWARPLGRFRERGRVVHGQSVSAVFRRPGSLLPSMIILNNDPAWTAQVLQDAGLDGTRWQR